MYEILCRFPFAAGHDPSGSQTLRVRGFFGFWPLLILSKASRIGCAENPYKAGDGKINFTKYKHFVDSFREIILRSARDSHEGVSKVLFRRSAWRLTDRPVQRGHFW